MNLHANKSYLLDVHRPPYPETLLTPEIQNPRKYTDSNTCSNVRAPQWQAAYEIMS